MSDAPWVIYLSRKLPNGAWGLNGSPTGLPADSDEQCLMRGNHLGLAAAAVLGVRKRADGPLRMGHQRRGLGRVSEDARILLIFDFSFLMEPMCSCGNLLNTH